MLIALKAENRIYLACNLCSLPVSEFDKADYLLPDNIPLWKVKSGCIMGSNELKDADLMRYDTRIFRGEIEPFNLYENVVPAMLDKLAYFRRLDGEGWTKSHFVIAQGDRAFHVYGKSLREEIDEYFAFGAGYALAYSSFDMTAGQPALERIKRAFEAVEDSICMPAYPIAVIDTKTQKVSIIEK